MSIQHRVLLASLVGSSIEWFDYFLYGTVTALVLSKLYFPASDPVVSLLLAYLSFSLPFFIRPLGGALFAHVGDRIGRKKSMIYTLILMGTGTALIGALPSYASIGVLAPILLVLLRLMQGIGIGGEWGAAVLIAYEHAPRERHAFFGSIPQIGVTIGMLLSTLAVGAVSKLPDDKFMQWGWRLPFLLSALLVLLGFWLRSGVEETPAFLQAKRDGQPVKLPIVQVFKWHWREVLVAVFAKMVETGPFYIFTVFIIGYATQVLQYERATTLNAVAIGALLSSLVIPYVGRCADRFGSQQIFLLGCAVMVVFAPLYFYLLTLRTGFALMLATVLAMAVVWPLLTATLSTMMSELFRTEVRYTGITLGYQIGAALVGGTAPLIATGLLSLDHNQWRWIAVYIIVTAVLSGGAVALSTLKRRHAVARRTNEIQSAG